MSRIDDDAQRRKRQLVLGGDPRHDVRLHVDCHRAGSFVQLALFYRIRNRLIDAENGGMNGAADHAKEFARPRRIGETDSLRFADGGGHNPVAGSQVRGKPASDAETDCAAIALPDGGVRDGLELAPGGAANDQYSGSGSDACLESEADKSYDKAMLSFGGGNIGDPQRVIGVSYQSIYKRTPGKIQLGCH